MNAHQDVIDIIASFHDWKPVFNIVIKELKLYHSDKKKLVIKNFNENLSKYRLLYTYYPFIDTY